MTTFDLKVIAIVTMLIDHIGLFFFPDIILFRAFGRLSFPLFAWLIANGFEHTHDKKAYFFRLFLLALISQVPYSLANSEIDPFFSGLNILFTLCGGFLGILILTRVKLLANKLLLLSILLVSTVFLPVSYGAGGILLVIASYVFFSDVKKLFLAQLLIFTGFYSIPAILDPAPGMNFVALLQPIGVLSIWFIAAYNGERGIRDRYLFYLFYPVHLLIIYWIKVFL